MEAVFRLAIDGDAGGDLRRAVAARVDVRQGHRRCQRRSGTPKVRVCRPASTPSKTLATPAPNGTTRRLVADFGAELAVAIGPQPDMDLVLAGSEHGLTPVRAALRRGAGERGDDQQRTPAPLRVSEDGGDLVGRWNVHAHRQLRGVSVLAALLAAAQLRERRSWRQARAPLPRRSAPRSDRASS